MKYKWDNQIALDSAEAKGIAKGVIALAREFKKSGLSIELIAKITERSIEEIENL